jgi:hypothetical protein
VSARLHCYWLQFEGSAIEIGIPSACGVTAWTEEDAVALLRAGPFRGKGLPTIAAVTVDVDVDVDVFTLDEGHVLPNMEAPDRRDIWYPRGFSLS